MWQSDATTPRIGTTLLSAADAVVEFTVPKAAGADGVLSKSLKAEATVNEIRQVCEQRLYRK